MSLGCSKVEPRKPINTRPSSTILSKTVAESIRLNTVENLKILEVIKADSSKKYQVSPNGFWYSYVTKIDENRQTPKTGNEVTFEYNITDLQGAVIYGKDELGLKKYKVDKEDFISGLQSGIKLMKMGETIIFVIPSYNAFGISGDGNRIGLNKSINSTVPLINIK